MKIDKKALLEGAKEVGRVVFFGAVSALALYVTSQLANFDPTSVQFVVLTVVGRFLDKYVHENEDIERGGVAPF